MIPYSAGGEHSLSCGTGKSMGIYVGMRKREFGAKAFGAVSDECRHAGTGASGYEKDNKYY